MAVYVYQCPNPECERVIEQHHSMNENPDIVCHGCSGLMKKKVGQCHDVIFKGHGFYITDNRRIKTASDVM